MFCQQSISLLIARYTMNNCKKQLVLNKGSEKYVFRYDTGAEGELLDCLVDLANDTRVDFTWFDAAVLSFKLTQSLICQADKLLMKDVPGLIKSFEAQLDGQ